MKTRLSTGGFRDYIELQPETLMEATDLIRIYASPFVVSNLLFMDMSEQVIRLRMFVSVERSEAKVLTPEERAELDQQT